ncbi:MAG: glycosyltransferase family 4 protein, partial [Pseudonocardiaceae bacterium]
MTTLLAVCLHDGFYGCGTGAGVANRAFLEALTQINADLNLDLELVILPIEISTDSAEYDPAWHAQSLQLVERAGGRVIPLDNGTGHTTRWGGLPAFRAAAENAAQTLVDVLPDLSSDGGPRLVVAHDVPFYGLATMLPPELAADLVLVAHSTAGIHCPDDHDRVAWETQGLHHTAKLGGRIAAISDHMRNHLVHDYGLPDESLIDLPIGLSPADWARPIPADPTLPPAAREGFWLAMGRAVPYKGADDLLDALHILRNTTGTRPPHLVLAGVTDSGQLTDYQRHLADRIEAEHLDVTLITRFSLDLQNLLAHPALRAVVIPSRAEPFGRIPLEAYAAGAAPV